MNIGTIYNKVVSILKDTYISKDEVIKYFDEAVLNHLEQYKNNDIETNINNINKDKDLLRNLIKHATVEKLVSFNLPKDYFHIIEANAYLQNHYKLINPVIFTQSIIKNESSVHPRYLVITQGENSLIHNPPINHTLEGLNLTYLRKPKSIRNAEFSLDASLLDKIIKDSITLYLDK